MLAKPVTPPMGWNSWDCYGPAVTEEIVRKNAAFMAEHLKDYGWEYIVVDIQWYEPAADTHAYHPFTEVCLDEYSRLIPAPGRFPSSAGGKGFAPLAEYVHSLGLKFGIHIMRGISRQAVHQNGKILGSGHTAREIAATDSICAWNTDMYGVDVTKEGAKAYYDSLFSLYASWGVDFIKCDDIAREFPHAKEELLMIADALEHCGREMVFSLSPGPAPLEQAELFKEISNMWRMTDDFWDTWDALYAMFERAEKWCIHSGAGHWPDADMLPVGPIRQDYSKDNRTNFTEEEQITMMTLWCIFRSPLMIGGEMTGFDSFTMKLLTNPEILRMCRDARHAHPLWRRDVDGCEQIVWMASSHAGGNYLAVFNAGDEDRQWEISLEDAEIYERVSGTELWSGDAVECEDVLDVNVPLHGARVYYLNHLEED